MILRIHKQPGFLMIHAPDGSIRPVAVTETTPQAIDEVCMKLGREIIELLSDETQPEQTAAPASEPAQTASEDDLEVPPGATESEVHLRRAMESMLPGSSKALTWLQSLHHQQADD